MMNIESIKAAYRRAFDARGEWIKLRRYAGSGPNRPLFEIDCRAVLSGFAAQDMVGGLQQGERKCLLLHEDLVAAQFALPLTNADFVVVRGKQHAIRAPDDASRRIAGTVIAYELQIVG